MTGAEFDELRRRAAARVASARDIDAWVDAVLAGEPVDEDGDQ